MPELISKDTLLYEAFAVLANVSEGHHKEQNPEWVDAFTCWRDRFHASIEIDHTSVSLINELKDLIDRFGYEGVYKTLNNIHILMMEDQNGGIDAPSEGSIEPSE